MRTQFLMGSIVALALLALSPALEAQSPAQKAAPNQAQPATPHAGRSADSFRDHRAFRYTRMGRGNMGWQHARAARYRAHWRRMQYRRAMWARGMRNGHGMRGRGFERGYRGYGRSGGGNRHRGRGMSASPLI